MRSNLVLFIQEFDGSETDAQVFVARDRKAFCVYATRQNDRKQSVPLMSDWRTIMNTAESEDDGTDNQRKMPMLKAQFKSINGVMLFLETVIDTFHNKITLELHCTPNFSSSHNFKDLWAITGKGTELGVYDLEKFRDVKRYLRMLALARVMEADMIE